MAAAAPADTVEAFSAAHLVEPSAANITVTFFKTAEGAVHAVNTVCLKIKKTHTHKKTTFR